MKPILESLVADWEGNWKVDAVDENVTVDVNEEENGGGRKLTTTRSMTAGLINR